MNRSIFGPVVFNSAAPDDGNMMVLEQAATDAQKAQWLQPIVRGDVRSAFAMTEPHPGGGSDPGMMLTTAKKQGDRYVIRGRKWFITGAEDAAHFILMARTSDDPRRGLTGATQREDPMKKLTINGTLREVASDGRTPLLWVIREELGMPGTRFGFSAGLCGACTVHVNGQAVRSCQTWMEDLVDGAQVTTIEGLYPTGEHPCSWPGSRIRCRNAATASLVRSCRPPTFWPTTRIRPTRTSSTP